MSTDDFTATQSQEQRLDALVRSAGEELPQLEGYQLDELKGRGTFGEVWSARQLSSGQKVAVKLFRARPGASWTYFRAEVERHSLVAEHPNSNDGIRFWDARLDLAESPQQLKTRLQAETGMQLKGPLKHLQPLTEAEWRALPQTNRPPLS